VSTDEGRTSQDHEEEKDDVQAHNLRKGMNPEAESDDDENDVEAHIGHRHSSARHS
jgi:hypothetical protein